MIIHTVWAVRKHAPDEVELVEAWDEYSVDNNAEGFKEAVQKSLDSWGSDLLAHRTIQIEIPERDVVRAFQDTTVQGKVV